jgi:CheY-like chemotaxis protein
VLIFSMVTPVPVSGEKGRAMVLAGSRILAVDDDPAILYLISECLRDVGCDVLPTEDGRTALSVIDSWQPDGVVLDLMMGRLDGWQTVAHLRAACRRSGQTMPRLCIMTAGWRAKEAAQELGVDIWLPKPFKIAELVQTVETMLVGPPPSTDDPPVPA